MELFFESLGIDNETFGLIVVPILIFLARILDVSINTVRIIFVMSGKKYIATVMGFLESLIWLLAIGQIFQHMDNVYCYIAYPAGFAGGILIGMLIEEKIALGKVIIRIITAEDLELIIAYLNKHQFRFSIVSAESNEGKENLLFAVLKRDHVPYMLDEISKHLPKAFYTIESVKSASEAGLMVEKPSRRGIGAWLTSVRRK
ncbi:DUF2179 domain-containing protein [Fulvivirga lutea]|uniref:UPF0316 protein JR347_03280 n=1 Tax=Fulvivirga lutea TaxID=2810512 RepID=A0A974WMF4_9BACT|nr:DUF5698 domain-containing protein [Fulvivirga lutea]QSE98118.1 hypothetical protein JR347_03280 [Fulvivirga lutea]